MRDLIQEDGWIILVKNLVRNFFGFPCEKIYLFRHTITERNAEDFMPDIRDYEDFMLHDNAEMEKLESQGYKFTSRRESTRNALSNGVIVFCIFTDKELVHIGRQALTETAKRYVDDRPYKVYFSQGEACTGNTWTSPKFRGKGLMKYGYFRRFEYLRGLGIKTSRNSVDVSNTASRRTHDRFNPEIYSEAKSRKILLLFKRWSEAPFKPD